MTQAAEGDIVSIQNKPTGSWHAHGKNDKLWLLRLRLKRDDGELVDFVIDRDSRVTLLKEPSAKG
ncbi:MAG: hypothetical protein IPK83_21890 [Planctomycetes bacterium]|nr:hypothetical protein [Planctomycetota bacterium]